MVEECDFDRQFLFDKDVAIQFHRYGHVWFKKGIIEKLTAIIALSPYGYVKIEFL
jgi:hypothetical protein